MTRRLTNQTAVSFVIVCALVAALSIPLQAPAHAETNFQDGQTKEEVIDLRSWTDRQGRTLADVNQGHSLALVIKLSPNCYTCTTQKASIELLRDHAKKAGMGYYMLMIPEHTDPEKYFSFADSLKLDVESFAWSNKERAPLTLALMMEPTHLLISTDRFEGRIVKKWEGIPLSSRVPRSLEELRAKFFKRGGRVVPNHYIVVLNDDVIDGKATLEVRQAQVRAIAESFAQQHGGKVGYIYETALYGFSIQLPNEAAAIEISRSPKVKFVEEDAIGSVNSLRPGGQ